MSHPRPSGSSGLPRRVARASNLTPIGQFAMRPFDTSQMRSPRPQGVSTVTSSTLALQHVPDPSQMDLARGSDRRRVGSGRSRHEEVAPALGMPKFGFKPVQKHLNRRTGPRFSSGSVQAPRYVVWSWFTDLGNSLNLV